MSNWVCVQAWPLFSRKVTLVSFSLIEVPLAKVSYQRITPCNIPIFIMSHSCENILFNWGVFGSFHFEHQCKCSSLDIFPVLLKAIFPLAGQSVLCRYIVFFLEETETTWTRGKVISRWIFSYSWIPGNNQFALEVLVSLHFLKTAMLYL